MNRLRTPILLVLATLPTAAPAQEDAQHLVAPFVVTYAADGLQLTPALLDGLLRGCVGQRVDAKLRTGNPDWPRLRVRVAQDEADARQPPGFFSGQLVLAGGSRPSDTSEGELFRTIATALEEELAARMNLRSPDDLRARLQQTEERLRAAEQTLAAHREELVGLRALHEQVGDSVARRNAVQEELHEAEAQLQIDQTLLETEQRHTAELDRHLQDATQRCARVEAEVVDLETKLDLARPEQRAAVRQELLTQQAQRQQSALLLDQLSQQLSQTSSSVQERTSRLVEVRARIDGLRARLEQARDRAKAEEDVALRWTRLEAALAEHEALCEDLRAQARGLREAAAAIVPVRVQLWI